MSNPPLKLFSSVDTEASSTPRTSEGRQQRELDRITGTAKAKTMSVPFGAFVKLLSRAMEDDCTWLDDFADDSIQIDADLHEVLLTYQRMRHQDAA